MKDLRTIRIFLAALFFILAVAYLAVSPALHPFAKAAFKIQIVPSLIAVSLGAIAIWLVLTFIFGRIYCATVCPVGTYIDIISWIRRRFVRRPLSFRRPGPVRYYILILYVGCLVAGVAAVTFWLEPWSIMRNICGAIHPSLQKEAWLTLGVGMTTGMAGGIISALILAACAVLTGRSFCTEICPVGTALGIVGEYSLMHIEIDPDKCINCMKCEDICEAHCVKVAQRLVDNSRCIRCFDCLKVCPNEAIRYQFNRNQRATPLVDNVGGTK
ncbi:MAG: 4Fe-4S binding protein [Muribaculaceae bacterium]|nr:4Fe-4S binding protein [Muribaculaceae bacterium]